MFMHYQRRSIKRKVSRGKNNKTFVGYVNVINKPRENVFKFITAL